MESILLSSRSFNTSKQSPFNNWITNHIFFFSYLLVHSLCAVFLAWFIASISYFNLCLLLNSPTANQWCLLLLVSHDWQDVKMQPLLFAYSCRIPLGRYKSLSDWSPISWRLLNFALTPVSRVHNDVVFSQKTARMNASFVHRESQRLDVNYERHGPKHLRRIKGLQRQWILAFS